MIGHAVEDATIQEVNKMARERFNCAFEELSADRQTALWSEGLGIVEEKQAALKFWSTVGSKPAPECGVDCQCDSNESC